MWMFGILVRAIYMNGELPTTALPFFDLPPTCPPPLASLIAPCFATMSNGRPTADDLYQSCNALANGLPQSASGVMVSSSGNDGGGASPRGVAAAQRTQLLSSPQ
jgi:hypothetical protein